jgi:colanic acid/amylovoran biosynthesis glycosyltransferase
MRIAFVVSGFPAVSETFVVDKITGVLDRGHEAAIYAHRINESKVVHPAVSRYGLMQRLRAPHLPRRRLPRLGTLGLLTVAAACRKPRPIIDSLRTSRYGPLASSLNLLCGTLPALRPESFDVIHGQFGTNSIKAAFLRDHGLLRGRLFGHFYGYDLTAFPRAAGPGIYDHLFAVGDLFAANSEFLVRRAVELGCPRDKILCLRVAVDLSRFQFTERHPPPSGPIQILTVGRLVEVKGIEYAIRAVAKVQRHQPNIRFRIVGDGPLLDSLTRLARELGVEGRVEFLGPQTQDRLMALYAQCHLFVLPSVVASNGAEEGLGGVLTEAQAVGLPVVSTETGGIPENVLNGRSGYLVPPRDPDALAERLVHLIDHPERWAEMGRAGRAHVEANFNLEKANDRLVQVYQGLVDDRLPGPD